MGSPLIAPQPFGLPGIYPEPFEDIPFTVLTEQTTVREIPKEKWISGFLLEFEGRVTVTVADAGPVHPEAPQSLIELIRLEGQHKSLGQREIFRLRGSTAVEYANIYAGGRALSLNDGGLDGAVASYDFRIFYMVSATLEALSPAQQVFYMLKGDDWRTLSLRLSFGDRSSLFDAATGTVAFTAFGSATGAPRVRVHLLRPLMRNARNAIIPAIVHRSFRELTGVMTASNLTDAFIAELNIGKLYRSLLIKTGVIATTAPPSAGVNVFASLSDDIMTRPKLKLDGKIIRDAFDWRASKEYSAWAYNRTQRVGYHLYDFAEQHDIAQAFPAQGLTRDRRFELHGDLTAAANQRAELIETEIEGVAGVAGR